MKKITALLISIIFFTSSCDVLNQLGEVTRFAECEFTISDVQIINLGGIDISEYKTASDFGFTEMLILGQQLLKGELPSEISIKIKAVNNQTSKAAISGLQWQLLMKNEQYGSGKMNDYVEVLPSQSTVFPVVVNFDFLKLLQSESLQSIIDLALDIENKEKLKKLDILLKVKPYYKSGNSIKEYPGYLNIRP
jgi:hypothetical protein